MRGLLVVVALAGCGRPSPEAVVPANPSPQTTPAAIHEGPPDPTGPHFDDWLPVHDDPARDSWQRPDLVIAALDVTPGSTVADIGAGTGYFTAHLARAVGPHGKVVAVDIEPALIAHLRERALAEDTPQVEARLGRPDDPGLRPGEVDRVLLVDTYAYIDDRAEWFAGLAATVQPQGRLVVVDFPPGAAPHGPSPAERVDPAEVVSLLEGSGWDLLSRSDSLPEQFLLVFTPRVAPASPAEPPLAH